MVKQATTSDIDRLMQQAIDGWDVVPVDVVPNDPHWTCFFFAPAARAVEPRQQLEPLPTQDVPPDDLG